MERNPQGKRWHKLDNTGTVYYPHLDVYKRQILEFNCSEDSVFHDAKARQGAAYAGDANAIVQNAASYTHLVIQLITPDMVLMEAKQKTGMNL